MACAMSMVARVGAQISAHAIEEKLVDILVTRGQWECAQVGIITEEELTNQVLAHLDTLVEALCGVRLFSEARMNEDHTNMHEALFGRRT